VQARLRSHAAGVALLRPPAGGTPPAGTRLLLVAGDEDWLHFSRVALAPMFGAVQFARSGTEALALVAREPVDLVVAALQLQDMDGFVLCRRVRTDAAPSQPAVLLVGQRADWRSEAHAFEMGASDFMARPFSPAVLQARVRNLLRQRREAAADELARRSAWQLLDDARVADLVAAAPDAWLAVDAQDRIVLANTAAGWQLGADPGRLLGQPLAELTARGSWPGAAATWPLGEGEGRVTALRLNAGESAR
jgi:CheY-like chemotaxis protein